MYFTYPNVEKLLYWGFSVLPSHGSESQNKPYLFKLGLAGVSKKKKNSCKTKALSKKKNTHTQEFYGTFI